MTIAGNVQFACEGCGKTYPWKPELAGKRAKCKCGRIIEIPSTPPQPEAPPDPAMDALYALAEEESTRPVVQSPSVRCPSCQEPWPPGAAICPNCGYNLETGSKHKPTAAAAVTAAASGAATAGVGIYAPPRRLDHTDPNALKMQIVDLYLPLGLLVVGSFLSIWRIMATGDMGLLKGTAFFAVWIIFEAFLVFQGCLIGIKWMDMTLGAPIRAFLKIGGVVVGPFGVAFLLSWLSGSWVLGFFVVPVMYYCLLTVFFDLEGNQVLMLWITVVFMQYVGRLFLVSLILRALFGLVPPAVAQMAGMALFASMSSVEEKVDPTVVQKNAAADNKLTEDMIKKDRRTSEFKDFFINPDNGFAGLKREQAEKLVEELRTKGAVKVLASQIGGYATLKEAQFTAQVMIVELPADPAARKAIFDKYNQLAPPLGYQEAKDIGQKYLRFWTAKAEKAKAAQEDE